MSASAQSVDADTDDGEAEAEDDVYDIVPQVTQHPTTTITGSDVEIFPNVDFGDEKTGHNVGVLYHNPKVEGGSVWQNRDVPEGFDSAAEFNRTLKVALADEDDWVAGAQVDSDEIADATERVEEAVDSFDAGTDSYLDHNLSVDYKVADDSDRDTEVQSVDFDGETKVTGVDVGGGSFQSNREEEFEHDKVMVWYGGITGQFVMGALDFNGRPSARFKDDGYLVKGLFQHPIGWFDRDTENYNVPTTDRSELARSADNGGLGRPPRVARPLLLRDDVDEVSIQIGRLNGGNMHEVQITDGEGEEIEPTYEPEPEDMLVDAFDDVENATELYSLYHGDGWQDEVAETNTTPDTSGGSFDINVDEDGGDDEIERPTQNEKEFAENIATTLAGTGASPDDDIFTVEGSSTDLEGLVGHNADEFGVTPDVDAIRELIYEGVSHLDSSDL